MSTAELEARAAEHDQRAAELEVAALGGEPVELREIDAAREAGRLARWRARIAARGEARAAEATRQEQLAALHAEIVAAAEASAADDHAARALARVAVAAAGFRAAVCEHDQAVSELCDRARALGADGGTPLGPRAEHGRVAVSSDRVTAGTTELRLYGNVGHLPGLAVAGQPADLPAVVSSRLPADRPAFLVLQPNGMVAAFADITRFRDQVRKLEMLVLDDAAVDAWMRGELVITPEVAARARERQARRVAAEGAAGREAKARELEDGRRELAGQWR